MIAHFDFQMVSRFSVIEPKSFASLPNSMASIVMIFTSSRLSFHMEIIVRCVAINNLSVKSKLWQRRTLQDIVMVAIFAILYLLNALCKLGRSPLDFLAANRTLNLQQLPDKKHPKYSQKPRQLSSDLDRY